METRHAHTRIDAVIDAIQDERRGDALDMLEDLAEWAYEIEMALDETRSALSRLSMDASRVFTRTGSTIRMLRAYRLADTAEDPTP